MPASVQAPFQTFLPENPDFNASDLQTEIEKLFERQRAIAQLTQGEMLADDLLDLLEGQDLDPIEFVDMAVDNINVLMGC